MHRSKDCPAPYRVGHLCLQIDGAPSGRYLHMTPVARPNCLASSSLISRKGSETTRSAPLSVLTCFRMLEDIPVTRDKGYSGSTASPGVCETGVKVLLSAADCSSLTDNLISSAMLSMFLVAMSVPWTKRCFSVSASPAGTDPECLQLSAVFASRPRHL